jgi:hypothetical protein
MCAVNRFGIELIVNASWLALGFPVLVHLRFVDTRSASSSAGTYLTESDRPLVSERPSAAPRGPAQVELPLANTCASSIPAIVTEARIDFGEE